MADGSKNKGRYKINTDWRERERQKGGSILWAMLDRESNAKLEKLAESHGSRSAAVRWAIAKAFEVAR